MSARIGLFPAMREFAGLTPFSSWLGSGRRPGQERAQARGRMGDGSVIPWRATPRAW
jgi:hypothetical protein